MKHAMIFALLGLAVHAGAQSLTPVFKEVECGQMMFKRPASINVELRNTSSQAVSIKTVDTGCGCTAASFPNTPIQPGGTAQVKLLFDNKQLGHFTRVIRVYDESSDTPAEMNVSGQVVTQVENFTGDYPYRLGNLLTDVHDLEFDDVNKGQRFVQEIHIFNPTGQNAHPTALRLPSYLQAEMHPEVLGPKQKGTMLITLKSSALRDYGLQQTTIYLAMNPSDKISEDKEISVSTVLLPPAVGKDDVSRPYAPKLLMSSMEIDMTALSKKSKVKDEITLTNTGRSVLEISKLQLFTPGIEISLSDSKIQPGASTKLKVTGIAKDLKKVRQRPRILMITNDPDRQKVLINIKK